MEKKIIAFGASNSRNSINKKFAIFASQQLVGVATHILDLNDFELPVYSVDLEKEKGLPDAAVSFLQEIKNSDGIIISLAEYNGLHTSAFKNLWDWLSRIEGQNIWHHKPMLLLSTSPSKRPENNVLKVSKHLFPFYGAYIVADFYLPSFNHFFKEDEIVEIEYKQKFDAELEKFQKFLNQN